MTVLIISSIRLGFPSDDRQMHSLKVGWRSSFSGGGPRCLAHLAVGWRPALVTAWGESTGRFPTTRAQVVPSRALWPAGPLRLPDARLPVCRLTARLRCGALTSPEHELAKLSGRCQGKAYRLCTFLDIYFGVRFDNNTRQGGMGMYELVIRTATTRWPFSTGARSLTPRQSKFTTLCIHSQCRHPWRGVYTIAQGLG